MLRLDRQHDGAGIGGDIGTDRGCRGDAEFAPQPRTRRLIQFDHRQFARIVSLCEEPPDERTAHVAAADEDDLHGVALVRSPKMALPTRTIVEPSAMASSRSALMPIDRVSMP